MRIEQLLSKWVARYVEHHGCESERDIVRTILRGFGETHLRLAKRQRGRASFPCDDEYDAQDRLSSVLAPFFPKMLREEPGGNAGGTTTRIDFLLPDIRTGIEVKASRERRDVRRIGRELKEDIESHAMEGLCEVLMCLVFDKALDLTEADRRSLMDLEGPRRVGNRKLAVEVFVS